MGQFTIGFFIGAFIVFFTHIFLNNTEKNQFVVEKITQEAKGIVKYDIQVRGVLQFTLTDTSHFEVGDTLKLVKR